MDENSRNFLYKKADNIIESIISSNIIFNENIYLRLKDIINDLKENDKECSQFGYNEYFCEDDNIKISSLENAINFLKENIDFIPPDITSFEGNITLTWSFSCDKMKVIITFKENYAFCFFMKNNGNERIFNKEKIELEKIRKWIDEVAEINWFFFKKEDLQNYIEYNEKAIKCKYLENKIKIARRLLDLKNKK